MTQYVLGFGGPVFKAHTTATVTCLGPLSVGTPGSFPSGSLSHNLLKSPHWGVAAVPLLWNIPSPPVTRYQWA